MNRFLEDAQLLQRLHLAFGECNGVSTDTRQIAPQSLFFALRGANFDGNRFADEALLKGAAYAVIDNPAYATSERHLLVPDVLAALQGLAHYHRKQFDIPFVAITGTNGKTTTKELVNAVLSKQFRTVATQGNLNNHIGVPLTLLQVKPETQVAIIEMGANHIGDIAELCAIAAPNYGLITNIGQAHLEGFGSYEGVIKAKNELYEHLLGQNGTAIVNLGNPLLASLAQKLPRVCGYGTANAFCHAELLAADPYIRYADPSGQAHQTHLLGTYNFDNLLAALCTGKLLGVPDALAHQAVCNYVPANNRSQVIKGPNNTLILDAYNANPSSMRSALESFGRLPAAQKVAILGDMRELGSYSHAKHREVIDLALQLRLDKLLLCGHDFCQAQSPDDAGKAIFFTDKEALAAWLQAHPFAGAHVLVKASRGMGLEAIGALVS